MYRNVTSLNYFFLITSVFTLFISSFVFNAFSAINPQFQASVDIYSLTEFILPTMSSDWRGFMSPMVGKDGVLYLSQVGLHGWLYQALHGVLGWSPLETIALIRIILVVSFSGVLTALIVAFQPITGSLPVLFASVGLALSPRLVQYSGDTYWLGVAFILPMLLAVLYARARIQRCKNTLLILLFVSSYIKFLCGYEFVTTLVIAPAVLMLAFLPLARWVDRRNFKRILIVISVLCAGFLAALATHSAQLYSYTAASPIDYLTTRVKARSIGAENREYIMTEIVPPLRERAATMALPRLGLDADVSAALADRVFASYPSANFGVLSMFFTYTMVSTGPTKSIYGFMLPFAGGVSFLIVLVFSLLLLVTVFVAYHFDRRYEPALRIGLCSVLGLLGPLSWYILGFNHAVIHGFITVTLLYIPWGVISLLFIPQAFISVCMAISPTLARWVRKTAFVVEKYTQRLKEH